MEETLVSSWIDLNFSIGLHVASLSCFLARTTGKLSFLEIGTRRSRPELTRAVNSSISPIAVNRHRCGPCIYINIEAKIFKCVCT